MVKPLPAHREGIRLDMVCQMDPLQWVESLEPTKIAWKVSTMVEINKKVLRLMAARNMLAIEEENTIHW